MRTPFATRTVIVFIAILALGAAAEPCRADQLFAVPIGSSPPDESPTPTTPRPVEYGRKGLVFKFRYTDDAFVDKAGGFPLKTLAATVVKIQIDGGPEIVCTAGLLDPTVPANAGKACYLIDNDAIKIYYVGLVADKGNLPAGKVIKYWATGVGCQNPMVTQTPDPTATVSFLTDSNTPRGPVQVELVFDISGSMALPPVASPPPANPYPTRMAALKAAANAFFLNAPQQAWLGDKVGVVYFSTTATVFPGPMGGPSNMYFALDQGKMTAILNDIQAKVPTSATSIGDGLTKASDLGFKLEAAGSKKVVVLFSDGEENTAPLVDDGTHTATPKKALMDLFDRIIPITAGDMTAPGYLLQNNIGVAKNKSPFSFHVTSPTDLNTAFAQAMADIFTGTDKLELVRDTTGSIARGATVKESFLGNTDDTVLSILLAWSPASVVTGSGEFRNVVPLSLPFTLVAPDGTTVETSGRTQFTQGMSITTIRFPLAKTKKAVVSPKGEWTIELSAKDPILAKLNIAKLDYQLIVMLDNPTLTSEFRIDAKDVGTGEPVPIRVKLAEKGKPVLNAAVVAELRGPNSGLGDILAKTMQPAGVPNYGMDKIRNDAQKKLLLLLNDPANAKLFGMSGLPKLTLLDNGTAASGDLVAGDGVYSARFLGADKEGHYRFMVVALGASSQGNFQRTQTLTVFARPKPDKAKSALVLLPGTADPALVGLKVTLKDRFGSLLGPDYERVLKVSSSEGTVRQALLDKLDGSYEISYKLPSATANPTITVDVAGKTVFKTTLNDLRGVKEALPTPEYFYYEICPPRPRFQLFRRWR